MNGTAIAIPKMKWRKKNSASTGRTYSDTFRRASGNPGPSGVARSGSRRLPTHVSRAFRVHFFSGACLDLRICLAAGREDDARARRGADLRYDMTLTFEEAAHGLRTKIRIPRLEFCDSCDGTAREEPARALQPANSAAGTEQVVYQQGFFRRYADMLCPGHWTD